MQPTCHGLAERGVVGDGALQLPHGLNRFDVTPGDLGVLVTNQFAGPQFDQPAHLTVERGAGQQLRARHRGHGLGTGGVDGGGERGRIGDRDAAPAERRDVGRDRDTVDADGLFDACLGQAEAAVLEGGADDQEVGRRGVAEQGLCRGECVEVGQRAGGGGEPVQQHPGLRVGNGLVVHHVAGRRLARRGDRDGAFGAAVGQVPVVGRGQQVDRDDAVGATRGEPVGRLQGAGREPQVRHDRSGLLAQADLVEALHLVTGAQRGSREHLVDRDDAGATDTGEQDVLRASGNAGPRIRDARRLRSLTSGCLAALLLRRQLDRDE